MAREPELKLLTIVARSIGRISSQDWPTTPPTAKKSYMQAAKRALQAIRTFERRKHDTVKPK